METALRLTKDIYNKRCISKYAKIRHYNTVIKPECLYAAETLIMNRKKDMEDIQKKERKIMRKILGPKCSDVGAYKLRSNNEIRSITDIHSDMKKRRLKFYGHIKRMEQTRLTRQIIEFYENRSKAKTETMKWIAAIREDLKEAGISQKDILDRKVYRNQIYDWKVDQMEKRKKTATPWTDERKKAHSERMKQVWAQRKAKRTSN